MPIIAPFSSPMYVMAKPVGSRCNLACSYCYYTEKAKLYPDNAAHTMSDACLERFVRQYIEMQTTPSVLFTWHGGETFMRPLSFYKKAIEYQKKYAQGRRIDNAIQTNGTLMTEEWCRFLRDNQWLVGVSIDGPKEFHDEYRRTKQGRPSFNQVMKGIRLLNQYEIEWNAMAVVNEFNADYPEEFYRFFKALDCHFIQFTPIVERFHKHSDGRNLASPTEKDGELAPFSITPEQWGDFLCKLFDIWVKEDVGNFFIQLFDATLANWVGEIPGVCSLAANCGHAAVMEYNGDVYSCDHFVFPENKVGNIFEQSLLEMMYSDKQKEFSRLKSHHLPRQCRECPYLFACNGECPKNRFAVSDDGETGLNYLCKGYLKYFRHVSPYMDYMAHQLKHQSPPANVMHWIERGMPPFQQLPDQKT